MTKYLTLVALFGGIALSTSAIAQERTVTVGYGDLDLTSAAGQARLDRRIDAALDQVCDVSAHTDLRHALAVRTCRREAASALGEVRVLALAEARAKAATSRKLAANSR